MHSGMARRTKDGNLKINDRVLDILAGFKCTGNLVHRHEETLDPKDYKALNEILEALGGKWNRKANGHLFPEGTNAAELLEGAMLTGSVRDPRVGDFFETPIELARAMLDLGRVTRGARVLEPSAGLGRIAEVARDAGAFVTAAELEEPRRAALLKSGFNLLDPNVHDFLAILPNAIFDAVLMNPPFSKEQDIAHVRHALRFVKPGGYLVSVMSAGMRFRSTKNAVAFRQQLDELGADVEDLPEGSFRESGTMVRACIVTIRR